MESHHKHINVYYNRNNFLNRSTENIEVYTPVAVNIFELDSSILLLNSDENLVLITVFKHLTEFSRKTEENVEILKEKGLFDFLLLKEFYFAYTNVYVRRFALMTFKTLIESINVLRDLDKIRSMAIIQICWRFLAEEEDNFCIEYSNAIISACLNDPAVSNEAIENLEYLEKLYSFIDKKTDPDILLHSLDSLGKLLDAQSPPSIQIHAADPLFPIGRMLNEMTNRFIEIRCAILRIIKVLISDDSDLSPFSSNNRSVIVLQQLANIFCNDEMEDNLMEVVEVLTIAMQSPKLTQIFFEQNIFDRIIQDIGNKPERFTNEKRCMILSIFAENAKFEKYLPRLYKSNITVIFMECLLMSTSAPATHILTGLTRLMKYNDAAKTILKYYELELIAKLLKIMEDIEIDIKTREQTAIFLASLLEYSYHPTALELVNLKFADVNALIIGQSMENLSVDYLTILLSLIETLAANDEYRANLGESTLLVQNIGLLLKSSFNYPQLVTNIFRCLCTIIEEKNVRDVLMDNFISASIKRALRCNAHLVKSAVTNFIRQSCRFPELVTRYIERGVLEILITNQKACACISTWSPAIDSILAKSPSLKFCIQNHLSFTDLTSGGDFIVSKKKFEDFRIFQEILNEEVSPLEPFLIVNYERPRNPSLLEVNVTLEYFKTGELPAVIREGGWTYCRLPGDPFLPVYLDELNQELTHNGLTMNPIKVRRCIDFENLTKRVKIVAELVARTMSKDIRDMDLKSQEECSKEMVKQHLKDLTVALHISFIPLGMIETGCQFERAVFFKTLADQIGLPCTLQRSVDGRVLFNEVPLPLDQEFDIHCDKEKMRLIPWRKLRPTHIVDLMYNIGELYAIHSREAFHYLRLP